MEPADVFKTALAMPLTSPSFAGGPYRYTNTGRHLCTSRAALEEAVPEPLTFDEPPVRCEFMRMECSTDIGRYSGAAQYIPEKLNGKPGPYTPQRQEGAKGGDRRSEEGSSRAGHARYHRRERRERKEKRYEEDCTAAYGRCRSVRDERRRSRDSGSERIRRL